MNEPSTSLDEKNTQRLKRRTHFAYPSLPPQLAWPREIMGVLKRLLTGAYRYPLADQADSLSCQPLFIVSAGRSGTILLRSMLEPGGQIAIPPEGEVVGIAARKFLAYRTMGWMDTARLMISLFESGGHFPLWNVSLLPVYERMLYELPAAERSLARIVDEIYRQYAREHFPLAEMWGDQSPIHSVFLPWLEQTLPNARFLHLLRDGRDLVASMVEMGLGLSYSIERWQVSVQRVLAAQKRIPAQNFLELRYEKIVQEPGHVLQDVCRFVNIDYEPRMLEYWKGNTKNEHTYYLRRRNLARPIFTNSVGRWRERLSEEQQILVVGQIGALLYQLGYEE